MSYVKDTFNPNNNMKNIHILPTDKPSRLHLGDSGLVLCDLNYNSSTINGQHIYITSDEEIEKGDYYIKLKNRQYVNRSGGTKFEGLYKDCKKIILTTDSKLAPDVQKIDDEFLKWLVKNPTCEEVEVNYENYKKGVGLMTSTWRISEDDYYKIIIPTEESEPELDCPYDFTSRCTISRCDCKPKQESKQTDWEFEISSGYYGYRNKITGDWIYESEYLKIFGEPKEKTFEEILSKMSLVSKHLTMTSDGHGEFPDGFMLTEEGVKYIVKQLKNK